MKSELLDAGAAMATSEGFRLTSIARRQSEGSAAIRTFWAAARANAVSTLEEGMGVARGGEEAEDLREEGLVSSRRLPRLERRCLLLI